MEEDETHCPKCGSAMYADGKCEDCGYEKKAEASKVSGEEKKKK